MRDLLVLGISLLVSKADVLPQERLERIARAVRNRHTPRNSVHDRDSFIESGFGVDNAYSGERDRRFRPIVTGCTV